MMLLVVGASFRTTPVALRERLAFEESRLLPVLGELNARYNCEAVVLSTCNRVELYLGRPFANVDMDPGLLDGVRPRRTLLLSSVLLTGKSSDNHHATRGDKHRPQGYSSLQG